MGSVFGIATALGVQMGPGFVLLDRPGTFNNRAVGLDVDETPKAVLRVPHLYLQGGRWSQPNNGSPRERLVHASPPLHCTWLDHTQLLANTAQLSSPH